ncbi:MAG: hypothetical protein ACRCXZ_07975 [Patescibacteria group bacterium]
MHKVRIIAGPDSLDNRNFHETLKIAKMKVKGQKAVYGVRTVGLKSRTSNDPKNPQKIFMGHDAETIRYNKNVFGYGGNRDDLLQLPTVLMAKEIFNSTGVQCATEIMLPAIQCACIAREFAQKPFLLWNPAVDQLGWHIDQMVGFCAEYGWSIGLKNGKWLGEDYNLAESIDYSGKTSIETTWDGLVTWASPAPETILIQRGCDLPDKGDFRNLPIHNTAKRTKNRNKGIKLFFDPSHSLGPKMRDDIVDFTIEALKMENDDGSPIYDGVLMEVASQEYVSCDTEQHISLPEFEEFLNRVAEFRELENTPTQFKGTYDPRNEIRK